MKKTILVLSPVNWKHKELIEASAPGAEIIYADDDSVEGWQIEKSNIIFGNPEPDLLQTAKSLEWMQLFSAGVGPYINPGILPKDVILTNASGAYGLGIAEHMLGVLLTLFRKLHLYRDNQNVARWTDEGSVKSIYGSTALIVGLGDIGSEFARRLKLLGAYTIGVRRTSQSKPDWLDELYTLDQLGELLSRADIISLSLPSTPLTQKIINADSLTLMKKDAVLINVGRGDSVDTDALCDALDSGHLLGAALDVTDPEPLPPDHRLWTMKNAIVTPHVSGGFNLPVTHDRVVGIFTDNLKEYYGLQNFRSVVDRIAGY